jgi:hypothetical protein
MPEKKWSNVVEPYPDTVNFENVGDSIEGVYESKREVEQDDLANPGKKRLVSVYTIVDSTGKKHGVWGSWAIDKAMEEIVPGTEVRITYDGKVDLDGGKKFRKFLVQVAA